MPKSLRTKFLIWHIVLCTLILVAAAGWLHSWIGFALERHHDHVLEDSARRVVSSLSDKPLEPASLAASIRSLGVESNLTVVLVRNGNGDVIYPSPDLQSPVTGIGRQQELARAVADAPDSIRFITMTFHESEAVRFVSMPIRPRVAYAQVGVLLGDVGGWLHSVEFWSWIVIPLFVAITSLAAWFVAGRALSAETSASS